MYACSLMEMPPPLGVTQNMETKQSKAKQNIIVKSTYPVVSAGEGLCVRIGARAFFLLFWDPTPSPFDTPPEASGGLASAWPSLSLIVLSRSSHVVEYYSPVSVVLVFRGEIV